MASEFLAGAIAGMGLDALLAARAEAARIVQDEGIYYAGRHGRGWVLDPLPLVLDGVEWARLTGGLRQRARLQSLILADLYGQQRLLTSGSLPAEIVWGHRGFMHQVAATDHQPPQWLPMASSDLARGPDGQWLVLGDRTGFPMGIGYAMTNRRVTSRLLGDLAGEARLTRLSGFFAAMRTGMQQAAIVTDRVPTGVLLWSGADSVSSYEQGFLATLLGYGLVEAEDLTVRDGKVWLSGPDGRVRIDVILRQVASEWSDPLEFRSDSQVGVAGMLEASRLGNVGVVNPLGSGVLENPAILAFLPELAQQLLGEDLLLPSATTLWCGNHAQRSHVLAHLDRYVLKPLDRFEIELSVFGWELSAADAEIMARRIQAHPWAWAAQERIDVATAPVVTEQGLDPRGVVLRTFAMYAGHDWSFMPGGLARLGAVSGQERITAQQGAITKDVWVLDSDEAPQDMWSPPLDAAATRPQRVSVLAPRVSDNLYWLGRYAERADAMVRLLRICHDLAQTEAHRPESRGGRALAVLLRAAENLLRIDLSSADSARVGSALQRAVGDRGQSGTLAHVIGRLRSAAQSVPDLMSSDLWHVLRRLDRVAEEVARGRDIGLALPDLQTSTLALAGIHSESMIRDATWGFLDAGIRVERAQRVLSLVRDVLGEDRAAVVEAILVEALVQVAESTITQRRLAASGQVSAAPVASALGLILGDSRNPRSLAFQISRLAEDLRLVGDEALADRTDALAGRLAEPDYAALERRSRPELRAALVADLDELRSLSDDLGRLHFTRAAPRRATLSGWADGSQGRTPR
ncbi:MAG: circularly permuted type 2 ATP-grasp protein [Arachnia sp.]